MHEFESDKLNLRLLKISDSEAFFAYRCDAETNKYQGWIPETIEDVKDFIKNKVSTEFDVPNTWVQLIILRKSDNGVVGDLGIHFLNKENAQMELGCTIAKEYQGNGYATEAMTVIIDFLFSKLNKHRIYGSVDPRNIKSIKLLDKLGFRKEAHFRESLYLNNEWVDDVIYGLLHTDWVKQ